MLAGAQAERATVVAHRIAGRAADLGEGRAGSSHLHAVDRQARSVARHQVEGVAAVGGNVDKAVPGGGVPREALRVRAQVGRLA